MESMTAALTKVWGFIPADTKNVTDKTASKQAGGAAALAGLAGVLLCKYPVPALSRVVPGLGQAFSAVAVFSGAVFVVSLLNKYVKVEEATRLKLLNFNKGAFVFGLIGTALCVFKGPFTLQDLKNLAALVISYKKPLGIAGALVTVGGLMYWGYQWKMGSVEALEKQVKAATEKMTKAQGEVDKAATKEIVGLYLATKQTEVGVKKAEGALATVAKKEELLQLQGKMVSKATGGRHDVTDQEKEAAKKKIADSLAQMKAQGDELETKLKKPQTVSDPTPVSVDLEHEYFVSENQLREIKDLIQWVELALLKFSDSAQVDSEVKVVAEAKAKLTAKEDVDGSKAKAERDHKRTQDAYKAHKDVKTYEEKQKAFLAAKKEHGTVAQKLADKQSDEAKKKQKTN